jgi:pectate lyase
VNFDLFLAIPEALATTRRELVYLSCGTGNPIDDCSRCDPDWESNRKCLADCDIGFSRNAIGGNDGRIYRVTDPNGYDAVNPRPSTLRHAVIQTKASLDRLREGHGHPTEG